MKLIKKHQFGGLIESLSNILKPKYSIDERPTSPTPPAPGWTKMEPLEPDVSIKPKVQLSKPSISSSEQPDALSVNNNIVAPIPKSIFTPYNKFLYDAIFTDANGKPYEYKEVNTNTFNKRFLSPQEASDFQDKKRNQWKQNDFRYALRSQISKHQPGGRVLPTAPPAEERYAGGKRVINSGKEFNDSVSIRGVEAKSPWYKYPAQIMERIVHSSIDPAYNDTVYAERPSSFRLVNGTIRAAGNNYYFGKKQRYSLPIFGGFLHNNYDASTPEEQQEYDTLKRRFNTAWGVAKHQEGGQFQEDLTPPSRGLFGEIGTNLQQGNEIFGRMVSSTPVQLLLTGITSGIGGMFGPTMKVSKTAKELVTNPRNAIRKFSRNLNARKGDPTYRWTKTSGNLREGGAQDYQFPGIGSRTRMKVNSAARSEGSGYSAQPTLNANPTYQRASAPAQTPMQRTWNHQRSVPVEWQTSRRVMQRNNLIDQARDWRNYIFESPRFGGANFKVIPK